MTHPRPASKVHLARPLAERVLNALRGLDIEPHPDRVDELTMQTYRCTIARVEVWRDAANSRPVPRDPVELLNTERGVLCEVPVEGEGLSLTLDGRIRSLAGIEALSVLPNLREVRLVGADLSAQAWTELHLLGSLPALHTLRLDPLRFPTTLRGLERIPSLRRLELDGLRADNEDAPVRLAPTPWIREVALNTWQVHLPSIAALKGLRCLAMTTDPGIRTMEWLEGLSELEELRIAHFIPSHPQWCRADDLAPLGDCKKLRRLQLQGFPLVGDLRPLANLQDLQQLELDAGLVSDVTPLASLSKLEEVVLEIPPITDLGPLDKLPALRTLRVPASRPEASGMAHPPGPPHPRPRPARVALADALYDRWKRTKTASDGATRPEVDAQVFDGARAKAVRAALDSLGAKTWSLWAAVPGEDAPVELTASGRDEWNQIPARISQVSLRFGSPWAPDDLGIVDRLVALHEVRFRATLGLRDLSCLRGLATLRSLRLQDCMGLERIESISHCAGLRTVHLDGCDRVADFSPLGGLVELEELRLGSGPDIGPTPVDDLSFLERLSRLRRLALSSLPDDIAPLGRLDGLECLHWPGGRSRRPPAGCLRSLRRLAIASPAPAVDETPHLEVLELDSVREGDLEILSGHRNLRGLHLRGVETPTALDLGVLAALPRLERLQLAGPRHRHTLDTLRPLANTAMEIAPRAIRLDVLVAWHLLRIHTTRSGDLAAAVGSWLDELGEVAWSTGGQALIRGALSRDGDAEWAATMRAVLEQVVGSAGGKGHSPV